MVQNKPPVRWYKLIGAAPKMLETLEKLYEMYSDPSMVSFDMVEIRTMLKEVIDQARGES